MYSLWIKTYSLANSLVALLQLFNLDKMSHLSVDVVKSFFFIVSESHTVFALTALHVNGNKHIGIVDISTVITNANILMQESSEQIIREIWRTTLYRVLNEKFWSRVLSNKHNRSVKKQFKVFTWSLRKFTLVESDYTSWLLDDFQFTFCRGGEIKTYKIRSRNTWKSVESLFRCHIENRYLEKLSRLREN